MTDQPENLPTNPKRIKTFATFFKNYMSLSSLVVAALPIPVTSFSLIPTFKIQTRYFSVYTSLFCFLVLAYVFYSRHTLARLMFRNALETIGKPTKRAWSFFVNSLPPIFILLSLLCVYLYHGMLSYEINKIRPHLFYKEFNSNASTNTPMEVASLINENEYERYLNKIATVIKTNSNASTNTLCNDVQQVINDIKTISNTGTNTPINIESLKENRTLYLDKIAKAIKTYSFETLDMRKISYLGRKENGSVYEWLAYEWLCVQGEKYRSKDILNEEEVDMLGPYDTLFMILYYLGIFLFAEASFVLMAIKEYLQEVLVLGETKLIMTK